VVFDIALAAMTDNRYRITLEKSWQHEAPEVRNPDRIWYEQIPCRGGALIGAYSLSPLTLQLSTSRVKNAHKIHDAVKNMPQVRTDFHFECEAIIYFSPELVHIVAEIARARKKRRLWEDHKAKLAEANQAYRFKPKFAASETPEKAQI
jgi:hypothetical protein